MGLDISAFEKATLVEDVHAIEDSEGHYCGDPVDYGGKGHTRAYLGDESFSRSFRGLVADHCYATEGETFGFRAGSYSGYNQFREELCKAALGVAPQEVWAEPNEYVDRPFFELINFSDCEGSIGPEACADLALDFQEGRDTIREALCNRGVYDDWFAEKYDDWQQAFELAAGGGLVQFH